MIAHQAVCAIPACEFRRHFYGSGAQGGGVEGRARREGRGGGRVASINARRLHSATMTNLIAAFRGPPDNYDDTPCARITLYTSDTAAWLSAVIKND